MDSKTKMTAAQRKALTRLNMEFFIRAAGGNPQGHEYKQCDITMLPGCSLVFVVLKVGMVKDENTMAAIHCRTYGNFSIGTKGGIKTMTLDNGLRPVARMYHYQYTGGR